VHREEGGLTEEESDEFEQKKTQAKRQVVAAVDAFIRFFELRTKSQYVQEITSLTGVHNSRKVDQRQPGSV